tara:strand:- start:1026 stop:1694 length:669 start_codon:yes stop_codon:yes gene_type:complete
MFNQDYQKMFQFIQTPIVSKENNILLEPLSCIFRMSLLNYKDDGMKISIFNNSIQYHEKTFYQGLLRSYNGDTREDLHNLYNPFLKAFEWYPVNTETDGTMYLYFYNKCHSGLTRLLNSYEKGSIIHHTLTHYCKLFKDCIDGKGNEGNEGVKEKESPLLGELKTIWKNEELVIIFQTLKYLDGCSDEEEKEIYFKTIDDIVTMKEKKVNEYVKQASTSYHS